MKVLAIDGNRSGIYGTTRVVLDATLDEVATLRGFRNDYARDRRGANRTKTGDEIDIVRHAEAIRLVLERREEIADLRQKTFERLEHLDEILATIDPAAQPELEE